ncbi:MAG: RluA family pseudouridine synthase [Tissierellia bacterium]|nr:RluA family pseudouridine synthase [Tissierellia bacterium]
MTIIIDESSADQRLDRFLIKLFPRAPRGEVFRLFRKKDVKLNGKRASVDCRVVLGDEIFVYLSEERQKAWMAQELVLVAGELEIVYQDEDDLVVYKARGLKTTPDRAGEDCLTSRVQAYLSDRLTPTFKPSPLGRLDKDTEGLVLFAKNYQRTKLLEELQRKSQVKKSYLALVFGTIKEGLCEITIKKNLTSPGMKVEDGGKVAKTIFKTLVKKPPYSLVEAELLTGKTHQIRISLASMGSEIVGDKLYGRGGGGQRLLCYKLEWAGKRAEYLPESFLKELRKVGIDESSYDSNSN